MCGILLHVSRQQNGQKVPDWWQEAEEVIAERGPDFIASHHDVTLQASKDSLSLCSSVLALRGSVTVPQPVVDVSDMFMLMWNGEVFTSTLPDFDLASNDSRHMLRQIEAHFRDVQSDDERSTAFAKVLAGVEGPFAVVLVDRQHGMVYFGRDSIGRRSLISARDQDGFLLTSTTFAGLPQSMKCMVEEVSCSTLWRFDCSTGDTKPIDRFKHLPARLRELRDGEVIGLTPDPLASFTQVLGESVRQRVQLVRNRGEDDAAQIAILFSGGLDCSTLAALAHQHLAPDVVVDLINVAFENPRVLGAKRQKDNDGNKEEAYAVPDRITAMQSLEELKTIAPSRRWRLVKVNVTHEAYRAHRSKIETLMAPCTSVMDLSIAAALYFAARGQGVDNHSKARVLLSGLGADELLGGYSRHRKAYQRSGIPGLVDELQMDLDRLPTRNLGRDDRIISSAGKEVRYPFLDRAVIAFLADQPIDVKMQLDQAPGIGDKILLRKLAAELGLQRASALTKRAIQFGARSAKMEVGDGRIKGHEKVGGGAIDPS